MPDSSFDRRLLGLVQTGVPLVRQPYAALAAQLASDERSVLESLAALRGLGGVIREISGIFDASALGYRQALVAFRVQGEELDEAGSIVAGHPGVSHCYGRTAEYDLWFTLAVSPQSGLGTERTAEILSRQCKAASHLILPAIKRYKLSVRLPVDPDDWPSEPAEPQGAPAAPQTVAGGELSGRQVSAIRALQVDLPNQSDPFSMASAAEHLGTEELLALAGDFQKTGIMRRYSAVLRHRRAGAAANVMVAWQVSDSDADRAGAACASEPAVSHCYLRPPSEDWPYSLYTMIHGQSPQACQATVDRIAARARLRDYRLLWTLREYKKQRVLLFSGQEARWEAGAGPAD